MMGQFKLGGHSSQSASDERVKGGSLHQRPCQERAVKAGIGNGSYS